MQRRDNHPSPPHRPDNHQKELEAKVENLEKTIRQMNTQLEEIRKALKAR